MAKEKTILIVGQTRAGHIAAARARQCDENARLVMVALDQERYLDEELLRNFHIERMRAEKVIALDVDARSLLVSANRSRERIIYDQLIYARDAEAKPSFYDHELYVDDDDAARMSDILPQGGHVVIISSCIRGINAAMSFRKRGFRVTLIDEKHRLLPRFSITFSHEIYLALRAYSIDVKLCETVRSADHGSILLDSGQVLTADLLVMASGFTPMAKILADAGAAVDPDGFIRVDDGMATTLPSIFACGESVSLPSVRSHARVELSRSIIARSASVAGHNAAKSFGPPEAIKPFAGTMSISIGARTFMRTGLSEHEARYLIGDDLFITTVFGREADVLVKLLVEKRTHEIIGGEIFCAESEAVRIDLLAAAVSMGWRLEDLVDMDMHDECDPVHDAAQKTLTLLTNGGGVLSAETLALWLKSNRDFHLVNVSDTSSNSDAKMMHVPLKVLRKRLTEIERHSPIVLYSKSGHKSYYALRALQQRGFTDVYHLDGGDAALNMVAAKE